MIAWLRRHDGRRTSTAIEETLTKGSAVDVAIPASRALGWCARPLVLLAAERLRAPDEAGVLVHVRKFAFGRVDTWFRVDRG
jgi:hypothetical protein